MDRVHYQPQTPQSMAPFLVVISTSDNGNLTDGRVGHDGYTAVGWVVPLSRPLQPGCRRCYAKKHRFSHLIDVPGARTPWVKIISKQSNAFIIFLKCSVRICVACTRRPIRGDQLPRQISSPLQYKVIRIQPFFSHKTVFDAILLTSTTAVFDSCRLVCYLAGYDHVPGRFCKAIFPFVRRPPTTSTRDPEAQDW